MDKTFTLGSRTFVLDQDKAEEAFAAKAVINGRDSMAFNLLPLKYNWAYELYRTMKANHWEPEDIPMGNDIEQWQSEGQLSDVERWIIRMGIGILLAAEGSTPCLLTQVSSERGLLMPTLILPDSPSQSFGAAASHLDG